MTTYQIILKKQRAADNYGSVAIQFFDGKGMKKVRSLKIPMSEAEFYANYSKSHKKFAEKKGNPYKVINAKIEEAKILYSKSINSVGIRTSLIQAIETDISLQANMNTINVRQSTLQKVKDFLASKNMNDIKLAEIDNAFIVGFAKFVRESSKGSTTKTYCNVLKTILNHEKEEGNYVEKYNYFKKIDYKIQLQLNSALTLDQVQTLLYVKNYDKNYEVIQMFLFAIFMHGIRFSDLIFLKIENFKTDRISYHMMKTNSLMSVRYDDKLVNLLARILNIELYSDNATLNMTIDFINDNYTNLNNRNQLYQGRERLLQHLTSMNQGDFLFSKFLAHESSLVAYDKRYPMTKDQNMAYKRLIVKYIQILKKIAKDYKIDQIASHTARYTFANLNLDSPNPDLLAVSRALGHKNIQTTQMYFNKNFGAKNVERMAGNFNDNFQMNIPGTSIDKIDKSQ